MSSVLSPLVDIQDFDRAELAADLKESLGLESFRARQLVQWVYKRRTLSFDTMTDIARDARERLAGRYRIYRPKLDVVEQSKDGTRKYLFEMEDGSKIESVLIRQPTRYTLCVSSQVGCAIGCRFCRTATMGLKRNLRTTEIVGQVLAVQDDIAKLQEEHGLARAPEQFQNIVFMGMGEPFHNFENVSRAVRLLNDNLGLNFSGRKITVSTSGLVPAIIEFGKGVAEANLAISLNATSDEVRDEVMPINKKYPLEKLLGALREYPLKSRKRITLEYVMLQGVNDTPADLARLPQIVRGIPVKINLIPYNNNAGLGYESSTSDVIAHWQENLLANNLCATIRWSKGDDISAACGQLATASGRDKKRRESSEPLQASA